jgi:cytochrome c biogenesis protein CcmG/thiol:disulfide interchange protein DsbE
MRSAILRIVRRLAPLLVLIALAGCGSDEGGTASASFLPGGRDAFEARIEKERGKPIVVNKWASWCGPCRLEFPFFRSQAEKRKGEVVFLGVNSNDNRRDAEEAFPSTAYYDSKGELAFVHQGPYTTEEQLAEAIDRYAR